MFARMGSKVTIIQRSEILRREDRDVSKTLIGYLKDEGIEILEHVRREEESVVLEVLHRENHCLLTGTEILVATGRQPNTGDLGLEVIGVALTATGAIHVNSNCQTTIPNLYAAGDVLDTPALVYVAAYEGNLAAENALRGNVRTANYRTVSWVIFTDPQISGVGLNETQARQQGIEFDVSILALDNVPRALAARDTRGFLKLLRRKHTQELIGARIVAQEGSELLISFFSTIFH